MSERSVYSCDGCPATIDRNDYFSDKGGGWIKVEIRPNRKAGQSSIPDKHFCPTCAEPRIAVLPQAPKKEGPYR